MNGDTVDEPNELFRLTLASPTNATVSRAQGLGKIVDDDGLGGPGSAAPVELSHGFAAVRSLAALPGPVQEQHFFLIQQKPYSSYEVVVDEISGDLESLPGSPLDVALIAADGTTVLRQAEGVSALGRARSLRFVNSGATAVADQRIRIRSGSCTTTCGADDRYRLRAYETTYSVPRFNNAGTQTTVLVIQNPTTGLVTGTVYFWDPVGQSAREPGVLDRGEGDSGPEHRERRGRRREVRGADDRERRALRRALGQDGRSRIGDGDELRLAHGAASRAVAAPARSGPAGGPRLAARGRRLSHEPGVCGDRRPVRDLSLTGPDREEVPEHARVLQGQALLDQRLARLDVLPARRQHAEALVEEHLHGRVGVALSRSASRR